MAKSGIGMYLKQIGRYKLLTPEQEVMLSQQIGGMTNCKWHRENDGEVIIDSFDPADNAMIAAAKKKMTVSNLRLVVAIAKTRQGMGCDLEDLVNEGNIGLMRAVEKFDWKRGYRFSTYACWWIRQAVGRLVANQGCSVRASGRAASLAKPMKLARDEFIEFHEREPTIPELAALLNVTESTVVTSMNGRPHVMSVDDSIGSYNNGGQLKTLKDIIPDNRPMSNPLEVLDRKELILLIARVMKTLTSREERILRMRFGLSEDPTDHENFPITQQEMKVLESRKG